MTKTWRPFIRAKIAMKRTERHWWHGTDSGIEVHTWLAMQTAVHSSGMKILHFIAGPLLVCVACKDAPNE